MNINSVTVCGRLTRDPELKTMPSGTMLANLSIATNHSYEANGEHKEETEYHNIVVFGKSAENTGRYLRKGSMAMVMGRLQTRSWDKDGQKQYRTEIIAQTIQFGPKEGDRGDGVQPDAPEDLPVIDADSVPF